MSNEKETLSIFGYPINIQPYGCVITVEKYNEEMVTLKSICQNKTMMQTPLLTLRDYGKSADEFIAEFDKQNYLSAKKHNTLWTEEIDKPTQ